MHMRRVFVHLLNLLFSHVVEDVRETTHHYVVRTMGSELELALFIGPLTYPNASSGLFMGRTVKARLVRSVISVEEARNIVRTELERYERTAPTTHTIVPIRIPH